MSVSQQGCGLGMEKSEVAQPEETGPGNLTCPFSPPQSGTVRIASLNIAPLWPQGLPPDLSRPLGDPPWPEKQDCGSPNPQCPGQSPDMQSFWQAALGRPGQRTERRRRSWESCSRPDERQKTAREQAAGRWVGTPVEARAGLRGGVRLAPSPSESQSCWRPASCWSWVWGSKHRVSES